MPYCVNMTAVKMLLSTSSVFPITLATSVSQQQVVQRSHSSSSSNSSSSSSKNRRFNQCTCLLRTGWGASEEVCYWIFLVLLFSACRGQRKPSVHTLQLAVRCCGWTVVNAAQTCAQLARSPLPLDHSL
jgi:hypothetical protein